MIDKIVQDIWTNDPAPQKHGTAFAIQVLIINNKNDICTSEQVRLKHRAALQCNNFLEA